MKILASATVAIHDAQARASESAARVARVGTANNDIDLGREAINLIERVASVRANASAIRAADEQMKTLVDIIA